MTIEQTLLGAVVSCVERLYGPLEGVELQLQKTRKEFVGDYTLVVFPLLRRSRKSPDATASEIGEALVAECPFVKATNTIKGFLNIELKADFWLEQFGAMVAADNYGFAPANGKTVMVEYSSPNTNKPLHLGHIRNNLLGYSVSQILEACGYKVIKANLVNDRGIHICKSMLAWQLYGGGETPES
ncbi:MAG: arginine--tRNA ligase, partial [Tidjanibacter sp.]|nr:arginine--tRNA ligase [Tidjanibacter sp.]